MGPGIAGEMSGMGPSPLWQWALEVKGGGLAVNGEQLAIDDKNFEAR